MNYRELLLDFNSKTDDTYRDLTSYSSSIFLKLYNIIDNLIRSRIGDLNFDANSIHTFGKDEYVYFDNANPHYTILMKKINVHSEYYNKRFFQYSNKFLNFYSYLLEEISKVTLEKFKKVDKMEQSYPTLNRYDRVKLDALPEYDKNLTNKKPVYLITRKESNGDLFLIWALKYEYPLIGEKNLEYLFGRMDSFFPSLFTNIAEELGRVALKKDGTGFFKFLYGSGNMSLQTFIEGLNNKITVKELPSAWQRIYGKTSLIDIINDYSAFYMEYINKHIETDIRSNKLASIEQLIRKNKMKKV